MRVISGSARGLKLTSLEGDNTRPTLDRVKEALFSMLTPYLYDASVLDLFAGSGALGIEALSRGAKEAVFVDSLPEAMDIVKENAARAKFLDSSVFKLTTAASFLENATSEFDIIFLDPPYNGNFYESCLTKLYKNKLIKNDGIVIIEWDNEIGRPEIPSFYEIVKERKYGRVMITLLSPTF